MEVLSGETARSPIGYRVFRIRGGALVVAEEARRRKWSFVRADERFSRSKGIKDIGFSASRAML